MTEEQPAPIGPLPRSRAALAQARRVLDELPGKEGEAASYRDHVPWVLDRLDNVWRTIADESSGRRTQPFGQWWAKQDTETRQAVKWLRVAHVKRGYDVLRKSQLYDSGHQVTVHEDGRMTFHRADGTEIPPGEEITVQLASDQWDFELPGLEDRPVQEVLEIVYQELATNVLPTAERLMSAD